MLYFVEVKATNLVGGVDMTQASEQRPFNREVILKLASKALTAAMRGDMRLAADYVASASTRSGTLLCIKAWCDTWRSHVYPDVEPGTPVKILHTPDGSGVIQYPDDVRPSVRWAGQVLSSRVEMDEDRFMILMRQPAEGAQLGDYIIELLSMAAIGINEAQSKAAA